MPLDLIEELSGLIECLDREGIPYALCGGLAVLVHGHVRATRDIDLLIAPETLSVARVVARERGFDVEAGPIFFDHGTARARELYRMSKLAESEVLTVDFLLVTPVFEPVWVSRERIEWRHRPLTVVSREGLAAMKRLAARHQDLADLENLGFETNGENRR